MALTAGARLGPYEIIAPLGAGGMGEVYRARDTRLDRTVAIKILPGDVAPDPHRQERFRREARAISSMTHPHICALYDVGSQDGVDFLVMEHLSGETLAHRLLRGALPIDDVLRIGAEIADALDGAHRHGVIHRDLKPANVMLTASGAKILDFGLAKRHGTDSDAAIAAATVTVHPTLTQVGTVVGTLQYMAPEQVEGRPADARSDLFALGAILYEMTTGRKAFEGASPSGVVAAILSTTPPAMASVEPITPPALDYVVHRCLAKDPEARWQSARDVAADLNWIATDPRAAPALAGRQFQRKSLLVWATAAAGLALGVAAVVTATRTRLSPLSAAVRFEIPAPEGSSGTNVPIVSPDGTQVAFIAPMSEGKQFLWVRALSSLESKRIVEADDRAFPFWSPDGRSIAFFADGKLKRINSDGGPVQVLCDAPAGRGGAWNRDGVILFAPAASGPLYRVASGGGSPSQVTTLAANPVEHSHRFPHFLSGGRQFTYDAIGQTFAIALGSLDSSESTRLVEQRESEAWSPPGYLLFVREDNILMAQPFNGRRLTGEAVPVTNRIAGGAVAQNYGYSVSDNGVLTYVTRIAPSIKLTWVNRTGRLLGGVGPAGDYASFALAPDGRRVIAERGQRQPPGTPEIWVMDASRGSELRLVGSDPPPRDPIWSPNGNLFAYDRWVPDASQEHLFISRSNGTGGERMLPVKRDFGSVVLDQWSPDGQFLLYELFDHTTAVHNLWLMPTAGDQPARLYLRTDFNKVDAQFSPDGQWVAYGSDESGKSEIYVQSFPDPASKWQVSTNGGKRPRWRRDGKELFYLALNDALMAVPVGSGVRFTAGTPRLLFAAPGAGGALETRYDVSPDGQRFLFNVLAQPAKPSSITVVLNWTADVKK
jgi:eukaryotic-like serine/threonine-protein kinase